MDLIKLQVFTIVLFHKLYELSKEKIRITIQILSSLKLIQRMDSSVKELKLNNGNKIMNFILIV